MEDVHRILVALGLGKYSQGVYEFGARMAQAMQAELIVANIINTRDVEAVRTISSMGYEVDGQHFIASVKAEREAQIDAIVAKAALPGIQPRVVIRTGSPIEALMDLISEEKIDAIVMGPKGRTDLDNVLVGSVAEKLFRRSPVTVISYRDKRHADRLKKARR